MFGESVLTELHRESHLSGLAVFCALPKGKKQRGKQQPLEVLVLRIKALLYPQPVLHLP